MGNLNQKIQIVKDMNLSLMALLEIAKEEKDLQLAEHIVKLSDDMKPMIAEMNVELTKALN